MFIFGQSCVNCRYDFHFSPLLTLVVHGLTTHYAGTAHTDVVCRGAIWQITSRAESARASTEARTLPFTVEASAFRK